MNANRMGHEYASSIRRTLVRLVVGDVPEPTREAEVPSPSVRARMACAVVLALVAALGVYAYGAAHPERKSDFDQVWYAARALWRGESPYGLIGIGRAFEWKWPFYYPLQAVILVAPVGLTSVLVARAAFAGVSTGLLAWGLTRDHWERMPLFLSATFLISLQLVQWSPLLTAALLVPSLSWIGVAKPNWGVALVVGASSAKIWKPLLIGGLALTGVAFVLQPHWLSEWLAVLATADHFRAPAFLPFGAFMLAAALRWRRPEARLLLAIACLPQTPGFYDALMLFTIPRTFRQSMLLTACSYAVFFAMAFRAPWSSDAAWMQDIARFTVWFLYIPCTVLVLCRPNTGTLPLPGWRFGATRAPA